MISPFSTAVILIVQALVAGDPLWLQVGQAFQAWVTPLLIAIGGLWAFYRFRRRRESRRRRKVEVAGRVERATGLTGMGDLIYLGVTTTVTNIGDVEVDVDNTLLVLESLDSPPETTRPGSAAAATSFRGQSSTWASRPSRTAELSSQVSQWRTVPSWVSRIPATVPYA